MPFCGGVCAGASDAEFDSDDEDCIFELFGAESLLRGELAGVVAAGLGAEEEDVEVLEAEEPEDADPLTVAMGVIFSIFFAESPAFERSFTEAYGRAAIILLAVAGPTPGKSSISFSLAVFKSTLAPDDDVAVASDFAAPDFASFGARSLFDGFAFSAEAPPPLAVTNGVNFSIFFADSPAFCRSLTLL